MFEHGFPPYWSTLKKLIWLVGAGVAGGAVWRTITGAIVRFIAKKVTPIEELKVAIEAQQSGSGDPSPTNIRPITGWTGANVFKYSLPYGYNAVDYVKVKAPITVSVDGLFNFNSYYRGIGVEFRPNSYTQYGAIFSSYVSESSNCTRLIHYNTNSRYLLNNNFKASSPYGDVYLTYGVFNAIRFWWSSLAINDVTTQFTAGTGGSANSSHAFVLGYSNCNIDYRCVYILDSQAEPKKVLMMLVPCTNLSGVAGFYDIVNGNFHTTADSTKIEAYGSVQKPTWQCSVPLAYYVDNKGTWSTKEISWETEAGTVYGGTLDATTGVPTVELGMKTFGELSWSKDTNSNGDVYFYATISNKAKKYGKSFLCSKYKPANHSRNQLANGEIGFYNTNASYYHRVAVRDDSLSTLTADQFKTTNSDVQIVYELATYQTYQLTPTEVNTLLGENNIWADCGDVTVTAAGIKEITLSSAQALNMLLGGMYTNNHTADDVSDDEALDIILGGSNA